MELSQQQIEAAEEFVDTTIDALGSEEGVHAETAVASVARMAGTFLFRSFKFDLQDIKPGQPVLSEEANEQGPKLMSILGAFLTHLGVTPSEEQSTKSAGDEDQPLLGFLETQKRLEPPFMKIKDRFGLSLQEAADAAAVAAAILIHQNTPPLNPSVAFEIAVYGFIEGTKTVPDPIA